MNAGVRQSNDLALVQLLRIRLGIDPAPLKNQYFMVSSEEFPRDRYACRTRSNNANVSREASPVAELVKILDQLDAASSLGRLRLKPGLFNSVGQYTLGSSASGNVGTLDSIRIELRSIS